MKDTISKKSKCQTWVIHPLDAPDRALATSGVVDFVDRWCMPEVGMVV